LLGFLLSDHDDRVTANRFQYLCELGTNVEGDRNRERE
jgi:hypothetical protein